MRTDTQGSWLLWSILLIFSPGFARADGVAFKRKGTDWSFFRPVSQNEQVAAIAHQDGIQKMVIAINLTLEDEDSGLWLFPVPCRPREVKFDFLDKFPRFHGRNPRTAARSDIWGAMFLARATQVWPVVIGNLFLPSLSRSSGDVSVHYRTDKWGLHAELITARSLAALAEYLKGKKTGVAQEDLSSFAPYLSEQYSLAVVWIKSRKQLLEEFPEYARRHGPSAERWPCLYLEFPTEQAYYPMRPTSKYGEKDIPVRLYVVGYVEPETSAALREMMWVQYYEMAGFDPGTPAFTEGLSSGRIPYTVIRVRGPVANFTEDIWFSPTSPPRMRYASVVRSVTGSAAVIPVWLLIHAALSYLTAGLCGLILFRQWRGYARLGLWNLLTLAGLLVGALNAGGEVGKKLRASAKESRAELRFPVLFTILFTLSTVVLQHLLTWPL